MFVSNKLSESESESHLADDRQGIANLDRVTFLRHLLYA